MRLAVLMVGDRATAEDVVQDAFEQLHRRWRSLRQPSRALDYASSAVLNRSRSVLRRRVVARRHEASVAVPPPPAADAAVALEQRSELIDAFRALPRRQREVLALRYYLDMSVADVAALLRISPGAVRSTSSRGLDALARILPSRFPKEPYGMPAIENLLRDELTRVADAVQPHDLRPLRPPAPRPRWRARALLAAAGAAVLAVVTGLALLTGSSPAVTSPSQSLPRYYLVMSAVNAPGAIRSQATIRNAITGRVTGRVELPGTAPAVVATSVAGSFVVGAYTFGAASTTFRLYRMRVAADGSTASLTGLATLPLTLGSVVYGFALSPDASRLAVSMLYNQSPGSSRPEGRLDVITLAVKGTQSWLAAPSAGRFFVPGPPSWVDGDREIAFTWQSGSAQSPGGPATEEGARLLDLSQPSSILTSSRPILPAHLAQGSLQGVMALPDGRDVLAAVSRDEPAGHGQGTVVSQILELQAGTGRTVRVLRTQSARYRTADQRAVLMAASRLLSLGPDARWVVADCLTFGEISLSGPHAGQYTPLPVVPGGNPAPYPAW